MFLLQHCLAVILLTAITVTDVRADDCDICECRIVFDPVYEMQLIQANCSHGNWTEIPTKLPPTIQKLDLSYNNLQRLPAIPGRYSRLLIVNMNNNDIRKVHPNAFLKTRRLKILDISENNNLQVSNTTFTGISRLQSLSVGLKSVHINMFRSRTLQELHLTSQQKTITAEVFNKLMLSKLSLELPNVKELPPNLFDSGESTLQILHIKCEKLVYIPHDILHKLERLKTFKLEMKELALLPADFFYQGLTGHRALLVDVSITGVKELQPKPSILKAIPYVERLQLHSVGWMPPNLFDHCGRVTSLDISRNNLEAIDPTWFHAMLPAGLKKLNISHNNLKYIDNSFPDTLIELDLSYNQIAKISNQSLINCKRSLEYLDLSNNKICALSHGVLNSMIAVQELILSHNCLEDIPSGMFENLWDLESLDVSNNKIKDVSHDIFEDSANIMFVNISNNEIDNLPSNLTEGLLLESLDLSHNLLHEVPHQIESELIIVKLNPFHCGCTQEMIGYVERNDPLAMEMICTSPGYLQTKPLGSLNSSQLCPPTTTSTTEVSTIIQETSMDYTTPKKLSHLPEAGTGSEDSRPGGNDGHSFSVSIDRPHGPPGSIDLNMPNNGNLEDEKQGAGASSSRVVDPNLKWYILAGLVGFIILTAALMGYAKKKRWFGSYQVSKGGCFS